MVARTIFKLLWPFAWAAFVAGTVKFFGWDKAVADMMGGVATSSQLDAITLMIAGVAGGAALIAMLVFRLDERLYALLDKIRADPSANQSAEPLNGLAPVNARQSLIQQSMSSLAADNAAIREALEAFVTSGRSLEGELGALHGFMSASHHPFGFDPYAQAKRSYFDWEEDVVRFMREVMSNDTRAADFQQIDHPSRSIYADDYSTALRPNDVQQMLRRLRGQREELERLLGRYRT
jgi:hypothetical protein